MAAAVDGAGELFLGPAISLERDSGAGYVRMVGRDPDMPVFPEWLAVEFLRARETPGAMEGSVRASQTRSEHPILPKAHASLSLPHWTHDVRTGKCRDDAQPVEVRYPFLDLRIVNYLAGASAVSLVFQKMLLREAMAGRLPEGRADAAENAAQRRSGI